MGIQVIKWSLLCTLLSSCAALQQEKELYREDAFCTCLNLNLNRVDTTFASGSIDVSASMILMNESVNPQVFHEVIEYTDSVTSEVYQNMSHTTSVAGEGSHFVPLSCLRFYNSKGLKKYIKARMKADAPFDPDSWTPH